MIIPQPLRDFSQPTLVVVSSRQAVDLYLAAQRQVEYVGSIGVRRHTYTDREGFYLRSGHGQVFATGAVREPNTRKTLHDLLRVIQQQLPRFRTLAQAQVAVIAAPRPIRRFIDRVIKKSLRIPLVEFISGNYQRSSILKVVRKSIHHS